MLASESKEGLSGAVEGSSEIRTGNTELSLVNGNGRIGYRSGADFAFLLLRAEYGLRSGQQVFLSRNLEHLRYRHHLAGPLELELFAQHDRDRFRRLALRQLFGLGHRLTLLDEEEVNLAVGLAGMLEFEQLSEGPQPDAGSEVLAYRISSYVTVGIKLDERLQLSQAIYVQPKAADPADVRVLEDTEFRVKTAKHLGVKLIFTLAYDSKPPIDVQRGDALFRTAIELKF